MSCQSKIIIIDKYSSKRKVFHRNDSPFVNFASSKDDAKGLWLRRALPSEDSSPVDELPETAPLLSLAFGAAPTRN